MRRMARMLLVATMAMAFGWSLLLSAGPSSAQIGYPPGPTTTVVVTTTTPPTPTPPTPTPPTPTTPTPPTSVATTVRPVPTTALALPLVIAQAPGPPPAAVSPAPARVALTGVNVLGSMAVGLALLLGGTLLVSVTRQRRARSSSSG